jgi:hypothetical protein
MSKIIDGWTLLARIAASPQAFDACDTTAALSALLLLRSQLVQGVTRRADLAALATVVGPVAMTEVIDNLAGYEALRVIENMGEGEALGPNRSATAARRWLLACLEAPDAVPAAPPQPATIVEPLVTSQASSRALRRHSAMGARRVRSGT